MRREGEREDDIILLDGDVCYNGDSDESLCSVYTNGKIVGRNSTLHYLSPRMALLMSGPVYPSPALGSY
jgi:hypothetical protein